MVVSRFEAVRFRGLRGEFGEKPAVDPHVDDETTERITRAAFRAWRFWRRDRPFLARPDGDRFRFWVHFALGALVGAGLGGLHVFFFEVRSGPSILGVVAAFALILGWACGRYGNSLWELLFSSRSGFGR